MNLHHLVIAALLALATLSATAEEIIHSYDVRVEVDPFDATLVVTETIAVTAEHQRIKRGIYRDFPTINKGPLGLRLPVTFEVTSVLRNQEPEPFSVESLQDGQRIRIGNPDKKLKRGRHTYTITYRTGGQLRSFKAHDEVYWNATGHHWDFPIATARVTVVLPEGAVAVVEDDLHPSAYVGAPGAGEDPDTYIYEEADDRTVSFRTTGPLTPGEGITVAVPFSKGLVDHTPVATGTLFKANWAYLTGTLLVIAACLFQVGAWFAVGRDPDPTTNHVQVVPPEGFSPAACRYLKKMGFDDKCFSAAVIGLASKNALRISGSPDDDFLLQHPESGSDRKPLTPDEQTLAHELLHNRESLALCQSNHKQVGAARDKLKSQLAARLEKTHFVRNLHLWVPGLLATMLGVALSLFNAGLAPVAFFLAVWLSIWSVGCAFLVSKVITSFAARSWGPAIGTSLFALPFLAGWFAGFFFFTQTAGYGPVVLLAVGAGVNFLFYHLIKAPTHAGRDVLDDIEAFEKYLRHAPGDGLAGSADATPEQFSEFLAYAVALDCEDAWGDRFTGALGDSSTTPGSGRHFHHPHWYRGSDLGRTAFASAIGSAMTASLASASQSPSSSSGSSGGGSSGGGGGGGGGGGW